MQIKVKLFSAFNFEVRFRLGIFSASFGEWKLLLLKIAYEISFDLISVPATLSDGISRKSGIVEKSAGFNLSLWPCYLMRVIKALPR